jgi:uncharacterized protein YjbI with pentapeptide repeats
MINNMNDLKTFQEFLNENKLNEGGSNKGITDFSGNIIVKAMSGQTLADTLADAIADGEDIEGAYFKDSEFIGMQLPDAYISDVKFVKCTFVDCNFTGTQFDKVDLKTSSFKNCDFTDCTLNGKQLGPILLGKNSGCKF